MPLARRSHDSDDMSNPQTTPQDSPPNGTTRRVREEQREPRLPFERDESSDSQNMPIPPNGNVIEQGRRDVERGLVDTDAGRRADAVERGEGSGG